MTAGELAQISLASIFVRAGRATVSGNDRAEDDGETSDIGPENLIGPALDRYTDELTVFGAPVSG
jgi:hypothetical protein